MNSVQLIGRLTKDPEVRYTTSQMAVGTFVLAVDRPPNRDGEKRADFPIIKVFGKQAEVVEKYVHKGDKIALEGRIQTDSYEKDGRRVYTTDVVAFRIEFLGRKENAGDHTEKAPAEKPHVDETPVEVPDNFQQIDDDVPF